MMPGNTSSPKSLEVYRQFPCCTQTAHQMHLLPCQLLEPGIGHRSRNARAIWVDWNQFQQCAFYLDSIQSKSGKAFKLISFFVKVLVYFFSLHGEVLLSANQIHNRMPNHQSLHNRIQLLQYLVYCWCIHTMYGRDKSGYMIACNSTIIARSIGLSQELNGSDAKLLNLFESGLHLWLWLKI